MVEKMYCNDCLHQTVCRYWLEAKRIMDSTAMSFTFHCDQFMESVKAEEPKAVAPKTVRRQRKAKA